MQATAAQPIGGSPPEHVPRWRLLLVTLADGDNSAILRISPSFSIFSFLFAIRPQIHSSKDAGTEAAAAAGGRWRE